MSELVKFEYTCCYCGHAVDDAVIELNGLSGILSFPCENCGRWLGVMPEDFQRRHFLPENGMYQVDGEVKPFAFNEEASAELDEAASSEDDLIAEGFFEEGITTFVIPAGGLTDNLIESGEFLPSNSQVFSEKPDDLRKFSN